MFKIMIECVKIKNNLKNCLIEHRLKLFILQSLNGNYIIWLEGIRIAYFCNTLIA